MRNKRQEFIDRFEELTKQEIKNYNDSLVGTHVALEGFRLSLKNSVDQYALHVARLSSDIKKVEIENKSFRDKVVSMSLKLESQINDFNRLEKSMILKDREIERSVKLLSDGSSSNDDSIVEVDKRYDYEIQELKLSVKNLQNDIGRYYRKSEDDNKKLKKEIIELPSEAEKVKEELLKKASISAIDNAGILKELEVVKKTSYIQKKMNEYFHTQLDRIKKTLTC